MKCGPPPPLCVSNALAGCCTENALAVQWAGEITTSAIADSCFTKSFADLRHLGIDLSEFRLIADEGHLEGGRINLLAHRSLLYRTNWDCFVLRIAEIGVRGTTRSLRARTIEHGFRFRR